VAESLPTFLGWDEGNTENEVEVRILINHPATKMRAPTLAIIIVEGISYPFFPSVHII
jgi:hypothetical protein